jgi:Ca-activated chloride channel family protein
MEVKARHSLFILDCSGSMEGERLATLKEEMNNLLASLETKPKDLRFGIIIFHTEVESCLSGRGLLQNDPAGIKRATHFVEKLKAGGGTAMASALDYAATKVLPGGDVDTIYLLSDGQPTDATPETVLSLAGKIHDEFPVKFHTIGIGEGGGLVTTSQSQPSLLNEMAKRTGGACTAR